MTTKKWMNKDEVKNWKKKQLEQRPSGMMYSLWGDFTPGEEFVIVKDLFQGERHALGMPSSTLSGVIQRIQSLHDGLTLAQDLRGSDHESKYLSVLGLCDGACWGLAKHDLDGSVKRLEGLMSEIEQGAYVITDLTQRS